ncbi:STAS domain-containing protein [Streptacidiphilus rugosus]|uniref:STAS domain-containing protein n=1 Tax=Streptacidiphilus rugosus TaxID=405783 RepID=UPI0006903646|nr:STAS domain-containing protein [Streptacidiphilus rugosus]
MDQTRHEGQPIGRRPTLYSCEIVENVLVYRLHGDLDLADPESLVFGRSPTGFHAVVVDLADVSFFGSAALNSVLRLRLDAASLGVTVHLSAVPRIAARVLEVTGADGLFPTHESLGAALRAL